jgi:hypothetical protein
MSAQTFCKRGWSSEEGPFAAPVVNHQGAKDEPPYQL